VTFNNEEVQRHRDRYAGFFCIMSNKIKDAREALNVYRTKDVVENSFDDLKNHLDMKRLRVHSAAAMDTRLFLQFLSLVYISSIRESIRGDEKLKNLTAREVLEEMETLTQIRYSNRYGQIFTESTPLQRQIMEVFNVVLPTWFPSPGIQARRDGDGRARSQLVAHEGLAYGGPPCAQREVLGR